MQNILSLKKEFILLIIGLLLVILAMNGNFIQTKVATRRPDVSAVGEEKPSPTPDPKKEFKSLDNFINYQIPPNWQKEDYVDEVYGNAASITLKSPDYNSAESFIINSGMRILIARSYDLAAEETVSKKLNGLYESYTYNILPLLIDGKKAMTMHEDYEGHHRFIYIATKTHLWKITFSSKSLEDAQRYQGEIDLFLNSVKFKN